MEKALDSYFEQFLALLFPEVHGQIDWSRGHESLDKEFQQVVREAELGRRYVDKLVKVWTTDGQESWVLVDVEVQTARDVEFPKRMYVYNYRVFDRYNRPVASLAVLADNDPAWRPRATTTTCLVAKPVSAFRRSSCWTSRPGSSAGNRRQSVCQSRASLSEGRETRNNARTARPGNCDWCVACTKAVWRQGCS